MLFRKKDSINIQYEKNTLYAPVEGRLIKLEDVNDPVFSQKMMGNGIAIYPTNNNIYSPVNGIVKVVFPTKHAIGIESEEGNNVILHCGIETVNLQGKYFDVKTSVGTKVNAGDLILKMNVSEIKKKYDPTIMIVIENASDELEVIGGSEVKVGDAILRIEKGAI